MNSSPTSIIGRLSIGLSRISIRHGHTTPRWKEQHPEWTGFAPGHGENIWVFSDMTTNQIVYSHRNFLKHNKAMRQIPFNGKNLKPAKIRKDYWRPMALIKFPPGLGAVGQSVFQKLREFKKLHELSWGHQSEELAKMPRRERGEALNDQKANAIADIAAVLGGAGRGNKIWVGEGPEEQASKKLAEATIYWDNDLDRAHARVWSSNVMHETGLPKRVDLPGLDVSEEAVLPESSSEAQRVEA